MIESKINNLDISSSVIFDRRSLISNPRIVYHNIHKFRIFQMNQGVDLRTLTDEQWGLKQLDKCHHISTTSTSKDGPQSFRVRICKTCCQEETHIELGTYVDQESAILVNDTFEILNNRLNRLIVLKRQDKPYLNFLMAKKYDRSKGRDYGSILDLIEERVSAIDDKKKQKYQQLRANSEFTSGIYNNLHYPATVSSEEISVLPYEHEVDSSKSYLWGTDSSSSDTLLVSEARDRHTIHMNNVLWSHLYQTSSCHYSKSKKNKLFNVHYNDENLDNVDNEEDEEDDENEGDNFHEVSLLTTDMSAFKQQQQQQHVYTNSEQETLETILALKGLSTVCNDQFQHQNIIEYTIPLVSVSPSSPPTSVILGDSDTSLHDIELETSFITIENKAKMVPCKYTPGEVLAHGNTINMKRSQTSEAYSSSITTATDISPRKRAATFSVSKPYHFPEVEYYKNNNEQFQDDSMLAADCNDQYMSCKTKEPFQYNSKTPIATLTWLASMEDDEVDVAKSLYELRGCFHSNSASTMNNFNSNAKDFKLSMDPMNNSSIRVVGSSSSSSSSSRSKDNKTQIMKGRPRSNSMPLLPHESSVIKELSSSSTLAAMHHGQHRIKRGDEIVLNKRNHPDLVNKNSCRVGFVGIYSPEQRRIRLQRFWDKRKCRMWTKKVKYDVRKNFADSRIRVKGRFVKKLDEANFQINDDDDNIVVHNDEDSYRNNHFMVENFVDDNNNNDETQSIVVK